MTTIGEVMQVGNQLLQEVGAESEPDLAQAIMDAPIMAADIQALQEFLAQHRLVLSKIHVNAVVSKMLGAKENELEPLKAAVREQLRVISVFEKLLATAKA